MTNLADGRQLFYFDETAGRTNVPVDRRDITQVAGSGTMRYDALVGEWVVVAGHRQARTFQPAADASACPLCPSSEGNRTEIPSDSYEVVVFENRFPSLAPPPPGWSLPAGDVDVATLNAGRCEVVCFTDDHDTSFAKLSPSRVRLVIDAWADRTTELSLLDYVALVFPFENSGAEIGVTIAHPHGQIYAYSALPPRAAAMIDASRRHTATTGRHLIQDLIDAEVADGERLVELTEHWVSFVPFAARWPFQVHLHPRRHVHDLADLDDTERDDLAGLYLRTLGRLHGLFGITMPYIAAWQQAPVGGLRSFGRLHLDLFTSRRAPDRLKYLAGSEASMGAFINDIAPEDSARMLREVVADAH
jgi:UDPglucose--hexose-1-phosphate uridylyltransferase